VKALPEIAVPRDWFDYGQFGVTTVLLIATLYQLWLLRRTLLATETAAKATSVNARAARVSALTARRTVRQMKLDADAQAKSMAASVAEATKAAAAMESVATSMQQNAASVATSVAISRRIATTNRQSMFFALRARVAIVSAAALWRAGNQFFLCVSVANLAGKPAFADDWWVRLTFDQLPTVRPEVDDGEWLPLNLPLVAGAEATSVEAHKAPPLQDHWDKGMGGQRSMFLYGAVRYHHGFGKRHDTVVTHFCWRYEPTVTKFIVAQGTVLNEME
jgi:hypothetical protein